MKKYEKEEIISKFNEKHNYKYLYSKFEYFGYKSKSIIICKIHGEFFQSPSKHIMGQGCKLCNNKYSIEEIKEKLYKIHGNNYEFIFDDQIIDTRSKIQIKCHHGINKILIRNLFQGQGCISCKGKKWTEIDLRNKLLEIHKNIIYPNGFLKNKILSVTCNVHGNFDIKKDRHLNGQGCPKCSKRKKYDNEFFIACVNEKISNLIYDKCKFTSFKKKVIVTCKKHGDFKSYPSYLLNGNGCSLCRNENNSLSKEFFLSECIKKHPEIDHSLVEYKGVNSDIKLICKIHGIFEQKAGFYLNISKGCKYCKETKGEKKIRIFLEKNMINFKQQYKQFGFRFDFYLPDLNIYIEFNGKQHYQPVKFFGGIETYNKQNLKDILKDEILLNKKIKLIKIGYWQINKIDDILKEEINYEN